MSAPDLITDSVHYVYEGVIKKPLVWILVSLFGLGYPLFQEGIMYAVRMAYPVLSPCAPISFFSSTYPSWDIIMLSVFLAGFVLMLLQGGYIVRVLRGVVPAPPVRDWGSLFVDGLAYVIIGFLYQIIPILIATVTILLPMMDAIRSLKGSYEPHPLVVTPEVLHAIGMGIGGGIVALVLFIILTLFCIVGFIRFSRTGSFLSAFEISEIWKKISQIGWIRYIFSLILLFIIVFICVILVSIINFALTFALLLITYDIGSTFMVLKPVAMVIGVFVYCPIVVYCARYLAVLYDTGNGKETGDEYQQGCSNP